jgi:ribonuclease P protein component
VPENFSLSKRERVRNKKIFRRLYSEGTFIISKDRKLSARYLITNTESTVVQIAVGVSRKAGKAVWRNRVKRLVREAYRLQKHGLIEICSRHNISVSVIFSPYRLNRKYNRVLRLKDIMPALCDIINTITNTIAEQYE